jgi:hypothetical protein
MVRFVLVAAAAMGIAAAESARIRGRVEDADTGQAMASTVRIRTADGRIVTDHPSFADGFRSDGVFDKEVPPGRVTVTVTRGFDYGAAEREIEVRAGEARDVEFRLRRRTPLRQLGWYCGDSHVHMIHGERTVTVDFAYAALAGRAEGLDYLGLCQQWNLPEVTPEALERACDRVSTSDFRLSWNLEAPKNYWRGDASHCVGHGWTAGMRGRTADGRDAIGELMAMSAWDYESEKPPTPNFESHALIHELGGMVSYTHPHRWWWGEWGGKGIYPLETRKWISNMAAELPFDTIAGPTYDAIDIMMQPHERNVNREAQELWFLLLNRGYRIAGTASSDTTFDRPGGGVPGKVRVYTRVAGQPSPAAVAEAMRAGRNFVTSGPLLLLEIAGRGPGDVVRIGDGPGKLSGTLRAWPGAEIGERLTKVELIRNGEVVRTFAPEGGGEFSTAVEVAESGAAWYAARCYGSNPDQVAITNAIYFEAGGDRRPTPADARVTGVVRDARTGAALDGTVEVIRMDGRRPAVEASHAFRGGEFAVTVPATARLRVRAPGRAPEMKSVFMDYAPLLNLMLNMKEEQLSDWGTFEEVRRLLDGVRLEFALHE